VPLIAGLVFQYEGGEEVRGESANPDLPEKWPLKMEVALVVFVVCGTLNKVDFHGFNILLWSSGQ